MKTIFITISRGYLARNILQTGVVDAVLAAGHRVVLLTPAFQDAEFCAQFKRDRLFFEPLIKMPWTRLDEVLVAIHRGLIYNATSELVARYGVYSASETNPLKWLLQKTVYGFFSHFPALRAFIRFLDARFRPDTAHDALFEKYQPDLIFATNLMEDADSFVIKAAAARGIPTVGMPKSWDNLSKMALRIKPDHLIVWSPFMFNEARHFQNYKSEDISVVGIPQFDLYTSRASVEDRESFLRSVGLDPTRRTILFTSEAKLSPPDPVFVEMLARAVQKGVIPNAQILVRPHFGFREDIARFVRFVGEPYVAVDQSCTPRLIFHDQFDYSMEHWHRLAASLCAADVVVTTFSTMTLDATACGKPVVNACFDGDKVQPYGQSIRRWFESEHYAPVVATGGPVMARSEEEMITAVNRSLENPSLQQEGRVRLTQEFLGPMDGHASQRVAETILKMLDRSTGRR